MTKPGSFLIRALLAARERITLPDENGDWPAYCGILPEPSVTVKMRALGIFDSEGIKQHRLQSGENIERQAVQILLRADDYPVGWAKIVQLRNELDALKIVVDAGTYVFYVPNISRSSVIPLGQIDASKRRWDFSLNMNFACTEGGPFEETGDAESTAFRATLPPHTRLIVDGVKYFGEG